ncbi:MULTISPECIES: GNAT family N-acetyltransferase [unclassified Amycolatopsis]|uniref:GNAT family N-acetyltransferase n=1 Tax=unclassified Amycolatopsis TaxID=2618356 RepID=UPI0018F438EE|nr:MULTISPECIES: GNAT family N-acetyltransferase [unclassified Amycolatopsis]
MITRVATDQWHAVEDDTVVGRGDTARKVDRRLYISIDAWDDAVFDRLAAAMLAELPSPLYTLVDDGDSETISNWQRAGFVEHRREREYVLSSSDAQTTAQPPAGVTLVGGDGVFRAEVDGAEVGAISFVTLMRDDGTPRIARIVSITVRAEQRRRGIGRALLVQALNAVHARGFALTSVDVDENDTAAILLLEGIGARRASNTLELMCRK